MRDTSSKFHVKFTNISTKAFFKQQITIQTQLFWTLHMYIIKNGF